MKIGNAEPVLAINDLDLGHFKWWRKRWMSNHLLNSLQQFTFREHFNLVILLIVCSIHLIREVGNLEFDMDGLLCKHGNLLAFTLFFTEQK